MPDVIGFPISNAMSSNSDKDSLNPPPDPKENQFSFDKIKDKVTKLSKQWKDERALTDERRELRYLNVNVEEERRTGRLKPDEIYIPIRIVDDNIRKEQPQYISYLTNSRNTAIFKPRQEIDPNLSIQELETFFTKLSRYSGWEVPFFESLDGTQEHGWTAIEITYDASKPGRFAFEYIAHEELWFSIDLDKIQRAPMIVRNMKVTKDELLRMPEVNKQEVESLFSNLTNDQNMLWATMDVQKTFYKNPDDNQVYVCWLSYDKSKDFIRQPKPLSLGRKYLPIDSVTGGRKLDPMTGQPMSIDIFETEYPVCVHPYIISENKRLSSVKGRAFLDEYIQEACSSLVSSIVNAWHRASQVMASPTNSISNGSPEETDIVLRGGKIYSEPMDFFHMPYPDTGGMQIVQGLITQNKSEQSNVNFAVNNREDSRKTAKEISVAQSQAALLSGVQVTLYSIFLRDLWRKAWAIAKSQMEQGLITDYELNPKFLQYTYDIYAAGDSEVLKRSEQLQQLQQSWPVLQNTPAAPIVMRAIVDLAFPQYAEEINKALSTANPANMIQALSTVLVGVLQEFGNAMKPEDKMQIMNILQQTQAYTQQVAATQNAHPQGQPITQTSNAQNTTPPPGANGGTTQG